MPVLLDRPGPGRACPAEPAYDFSRMAMGPTEEGLGCKNDWWT